MSWKKLMKWKEHVIKEYLTHGSKNSQEKLDSIFNCMLTKPLQHLWDTAKTILRGKSVALKFYLILTSLPQVVIREGDPYKISLFGG